MYMYLYPSILQQLYVSSSNSSRGREVEIGCATRTVNLCPSNADKSCCRCEHFPFTSRPFGVHDQAIKVLGLCPDAFR